MPKKKITENDEVLASLLFAEEGWTQAQIALELGVSPAVVSRILVRAEQLRYIERKAHFLRDNVPLPLMSALENRLLASEITAKLDAVTRYLSGRPGPKVRVFKTQPTDSMEDYLTAFARLAAPYVMQLLSRATRCGVTWGRMLANLVAAARSAGVHADCSTEFVPLAGEPLGFAPTSSSSSIIADEMQRLLRGPGHPARSLTMLPALIPRDFGQQERQVIKNLISRLSDYREIFLGGQSLCAPLAETLDAVVTSVGADPLGFRGGSLLDEHVERPLFMGDIGGVLLPHRIQDTSGHLTDVVADLADRWTGLRLPHLSACAATASPARVGVVVLSVGASRAPVVFECVKLGLISHLIVDAELEAQLLSLASVRPRA